MARRGRRRPVPSAHPGRCRSEDGLLTARIGYQVLRMLRFKLSGRPVGVAEASGRGVAVTLILAAGRDGCKTGRRVEADAWMQSTASYNDW
jgi:hypothetical protein